MLSKTAFVHRLPFTGRFHHLSSRCAMAAALAGIPLLVLCGNAEAKTVPMRRGRDPKAGADSAKLLLPIPKGFCPPAQGCEPASYAGKTSQNGTDLSVYWTGLKVLRR